MLGNANSMRRNKNGNIQWLSKISGYLLCALDHLFDFTVSLHSNVFKSLYNYPKGFDFHSVGVLV